MVALVWNSRPCLLSACLFCPSPPYSLPGCPAPAVLSPALSGWSSLPPFPTPDRGWDWWCGGLEQWGEVGTRAARLLVLSPRLARGCRVCVQGLIHLGCSSRWGSGEGSSLGLPLANTKPSHASQSTQGLTPSACCQVLSVFFPKASDCFLKKPDPRAYTKAGAARGETPFSPALSLPPHLHNLSRFGCWVWVPGPGCHHLGNRGLWLPW